MLFVSLMSWWYGAGIALVIRKIRSWLASMYDYFSIDLLLRTLFAPFRQISAGRVNGPIGIQMRAFFDRAFSRMIGGFIRSMMIIFGIVALLLTVMAGVLYLVMWIVMPLLTIAGLILALTGYLPWNN